MSAPPLTFDRASGELAGANIVERLAAIAMQAGSKATVPFAHRGFSTGCRVLRTVLGTRDIAVKLTDDAVFSFPFGDGYWSFLLDRGFTYEVEIDRFLKAVAGLEYTFVDCGANFGLWSVLVTSAAYGRHPAIAIEASGANAERLKTNAALNGNRFKVLHRAVGAVDGGEAWVAGSKHEGMSVASSRGEAGGEAVKLISLDALIDRGLIDPALPVVAKLDVEGMEIDALEGAKRLLAADAAVICEDHGADRTHKVSRYLLERTNCSLFAFDRHASRFERLTDLAMVDRIKTSRSVGYNIFAVTSPLWEGPLAAAASARH